MLDGVSLLSEPGRRSLSQLRAGIPIDIEVGRESGRSTLRAIPSARLRAIPSAREGNVRVRSRSGDVTAFGAAVSRAGFNVFRLRDDSGKITEFQFGPESDGPPSADGWVVFSPDVAGSMQVHVGDGEHATLMVDGESVTLTELEGHLVELSENLLEGVQEFAVKIAVDEIGEAVRRTLVLDNPELARRLETIRVESMAAAREQLELLVERRAALESRGEIPAGYSYSVRTRESPETPGSRAPRVGAVLSGVPEATVRLGGAEFRVLTPELAEYFEVESGLLVLRVIPGTPVATLGLRGGDVVIEVGGHEDLDMSMFLHLAASAEGDGVEVKWIRKGISHTGRLAGR